MICAHGGKLINKIISKEESRDILKKNYLRIVAGRDFILDLEKIAIGAYSPLTGFMKKSDIESVIYKMRLASGCVWTIPIFLPVEDKIALDIKKNELIIICEENGREVGLLRAEEVFSFNKPAWAKEVFGTKSLNHPGVKKLFDTHNKLIGGEVWLLDKPDFEFEKFNLSPQQTREIILERNWKTVASFQTRNIPHRAHEFQQKLALSITDGILIHPIIGWKKAGDFHPEHIIKAYKVLIKNYFPRNSVIFAGLATAMRYAGPREAVFHAIIRKNYGCTHFIVGRDHAGVGDFYGKYDAHHIFETLPDLGIKPLLFREPYYCNKCREMVSDRICPHGTKWHNYISGTKIRELLSTKKDIPEFMMRKEVVEAMRSGKTNYFL
ncbi:MAG: sulfate adenylyltransferase [Candidatus Omnitrophica bacterium]|nr:sulfate adenylyltransferase [Candidatus Omnitrophota bacterium]